MKEFLWKQHSCYHCASIKSQFRVEELGCEKKGPFLTSSWPLIDVIEPWKRPAVLFLYHKKFNGQMEKFHSVHIWMENGTQKSYDLKLTRWRCCCCSTRRSWQKRVMVGVAQIKRTLPQTFNSIPQQINRLQAENKPNSHFRLSFIWKNFHLIDIFTFDWA